MMPARGIVWTTQTLKCGQVSLAFIKSSSLSQQSASLDTKEVQKQKTPGSDKSDEALVTGNEYLTFWTLHCGDEVKEYI